MILTLEGKNFANIPGFYREINRLFMAGEDWQLGESLDALDDLLYGGYGVLLGVKAVDLIWQDFEKSRRDLGRETTRDWLLAKLAQPGHFNRDTIHRQLRALEAGHGQSYFDIIQEIITSHAQIRLIPR